MPAAYDGVAAHPLPAGVEAGALPLLVARALRAFADGYMAVLLPAYLIAIGLGAVQVGIVATATMLGSAVATVAVGAWGHRVASQHLLRGAALLMAATGVGFAGLSSFWPLLVVAFGRWEMSRLLPSGAEADGTGLAGQR